MGFTEAVQTCLTKYVGFEGRAARPEYWWFALALALAYLVAILIDTYVINYPVLRILLWLATILPSLGVGVRRLHDTDRSGWWLLISVIPIIGTIVLIVWLATAGSPGQNRFGAQPAR